MTIDQMVKRIQEKNPNITRATIRGRLSELVNAGEVKVKGTDPKNTDSSNTFKSIPIEDRHVKVTSVEVNEVEPESITN